MTPSPQPHGQKAERCEACNNQASKPNFREWLRRITSTPFLLSKPKPKQEDSIGNTHHEAAEEARGVCLKETFCAAELLANQIDDPDGQIRVLKEKSDCCSCHYFREFQGLNDLLVVEKCDSKNKSKMPQRSCCDSFHLEPNNNSREQQNSLCLCALH